MPRGWGAATGGTRGIHLGKNNYYREGTWNAQCWTCGIPGKASDMRKLSVYDGNGWVCRKCYEIPNPQNFVRGIPDRPWVPWTQPLPPPLFIANGTTTSSQVKAKVFLLGGRLLGGQLLG